MAKPDFEQVGKLISQPRCEDEKRQFLALLGWDQMWRDKTRYPATRVDPITALLISLYPTEEETEETKEEEKEKSGFNSTNTPRLVFTSEEAYCEQERKWVHLLRGDNKELMRTAMGTCIVRFIRSYLTLPKLMENDGIDFPEHVKMVREFLDKTCESMNLRPEILKRVKEDVAGLSLHLGDARVHRMTNQGEVGQNIKPSELQKIMKRVQVSEDPKHCMDSRDKLSEDARDLVRMWVFGHWYQLNSPAGVEWLRHYFVSMSQWGDPATHERLLSRLLNEGPRRPIICHLGSKSWLVVDYLKGTFARGSADEAISMWWNLVEKVQEYESMDNYSFIPKLYS